MKVSGWCMQLKASITFTPVGSLFWIFRVFCFQTATAKSLQLCPTLCDPRDGSPPGSPVPGILQARTLEWVAISFSNTWKWKVKVKSLSRVRLLVTPWTAAYQAPLSMGFSRQEYWSGVPLPKHLLKCWCLILNRQEHTVCGVLHSIMSSRTLLFHFHFHSVSKNSDWNVVGVL